MGAALTSLYPVSLRMGPIEWLFHANSNLGQYTQTQFWQVFGGSKSKRSNIIIRREFWKDGKEMRDDNIYRLWSELPYDVAMFIMQQLGVTDRVRMSAVCKAWRLAALTAHKNLPPASEVPWLLVTPPTPPSGSKSSSSNTNNHRHVSFFSMSGGKVYKFNVPKPIQGGWCCSSSKGWLVMAKGTQKRPQFFLFNPISGVHLQLPSITTIPSFHGYFNDRYRAKTNFSFFIMKIKLSSEEPSSCVVSAICKDGKVLAICKPSDKKWTVLQIGQGLDDDETFMFLDMLFVKGTLYVIYSLLDGQEFAQMTLSDITVDLANSCKVSVKVIRIYFDILNFDPLDRGTYLELYLVESTSNSKPLVVVQFIECIGMNRDEDEDEEEEEGQEDEEEEEGHGDEEEEGHEDEEEDEDGGIPYHGYLKTSKFKVYQLNLIEGNNNSNSGTSTSSSYECKLVSNLDDQVLFIGNSGTLLLSATRNHTNGNARGGPRGNCIYFVDDKNYGGYYYPVVSRDSGVFSIANTKIYRHLPCLNPGANNFYWFTPSPSL